uniref:hypothetical protein n=1 Tax=Pedobacter schmidteae TaxID=2201271 RepID=UPI000EB098A5|nr:hypothetical protein [Pedobacter schmidteae]
MINKNLVYLSYGNDAEYRRTVFSILSFCAWCGDCLNTTRIVVYTDALIFFDAYLKDIEVEYVFLSEEQLKEMSGPDDFIHRRKVAVINFTFEKYPDLDQLFIDSDTFFISPASILFKPQHKQESFMHIREYRIEEAPTIFGVFNQQNFPMSFIDYIEQRDFEVGGKNIHFTQQYYSWNSGVLGLSKYFFAYMPDVIRLTDLFFSGSKWFVSEQLAFSFVLQDVTEIKPSGHLIMHYWGRRQKMLMDNLLIHDLAESNAGRLNSLTGIRSMTLSWKKKIENDLILEQLEIARRSGSWYYGGKKIIQFLLSNGFNMNSYKELLKSLKKCH